jgi:membrane-bound lytic murein transglycosylase F
MHARLRPPALVALTAAWAALLPGCHEKSWPADAGEPVPAPTRPARYFESGDLADLQKRGVLRAIIESTEEARLTTIGGSRATDREWIVDFGKRHGLQVEFVLAPGPSQLTPMLLEGMGDVVLAPITVTPERATRLAFTRPVAIVSEMLVGRRGAQNPRSVAELKGRAVHVSANSASAQALAALNAEQRAGVIVVSVPAETDPQELAFEVADAKRPLTVLQSNVLDALEILDDRLERLFPIAAARPLAWALRPTNPALKAALDQHLAGHPLPGQPKDRSVGDLGAIRARGALRVLTCNTPLTYYLHRGQRYGFDFEVARLAAEALGVQLEMIVAPTRDLLVPWLREGRGDVIAAALEVSDERSKLVTFSAPYLRYDEVVVRAVHGPRLAKLGDLRGQRLAVRAGSGAHELLASLLPVHGPFEVVPIAKGEQTSETVSRVARGDVHFAVLEGHELQVELSFRSDVEAAYVLPSKTDGAIAFAVRPDSVQLLAALNELVKRTPESHEFQLIRRRYFEGRAVAATDRDALQDASRTRLSAYDGLIRMYSREYGLDWRLMAAQAFQESGFDPSMQSWSGALGLFQVLPITGRSLGFSRLDEAAQGVHAGILAVRHLLRELDAGISQEQRMRLALAAYAVGIGHVRDAQRVAAELGLDPHKWSGNVEKAMLLLEEPTHYRRASHGYCRGRDAVRYVNEIQRRYEAHCERVPL